MLPGPRLLLRAALLLGTARFSPAAPDSDWSSPGTLGQQVLTRSLPAHGRPHTPSLAWVAAAEGSPRAPQQISAGTGGLMMENYGRRDSELSPATPKQMQNRPRASTNPNRTGTDRPSEPNRTGTDRPSEPNRTGTDRPSEPNRTGTDRPSEPNRTGTDRPSEPNRTGTDRPSEPNRTGTDRPSEPNRTGTDRPSEPNRTGTDRPSEPNRTGTDRPSEPNRTGTDRPSEPNRTGTDRPSEPNRTGTDRPSEPNRTGTDRPSEPNRTGTDRPSEPNRTGTDRPSEPNRTGTDRPSEPNRTGTDPPSEPNRTGTDRPSEPNRTGTDRPSEPNRTGIDRPSEPNRTGTDPPSEPNRTGTDPPSEPNRTGTDRPSEPNRTGTDRPSEPNRTGIDRPSEPNRTGTDPPSEPNRTGTDPPSEPNRTGTDRPSEPNRTELPSLSADMRKTPTSAGSDQTELHLGPLIYYRSEQDWTELDITQTSSAAGIFQKSATQRHLHKRTPHMDTWTSISSTRGGGGRTKDTNVTHITEIPNTYPPKTGNVSEDLATTALGYGNTTEGAEGRNMSVPGTYPLQTPSYVMTTYPTSHPVPNATVPFTSAPVTAPNTSSHPDTPSHSSSSPWSSSPSDLPAGGSLSSETTLAATTMSAASSSPPSQQPPAQTSSSSSPVPSTLVSTTRSSALPAPTTQTPRPLTAMSSTPGPPASPPSLPPFSSTESTPRPENETLVSVISLATNTPMAATTETPQTVTERRDETSTQDRTTTWKPVEAETLEMSTDGERTGGVTETPTISNPPSTTSTSSPAAPSAHVTTEKTQRDTVRTEEPERPALTTAEPDIRTVRTTQRALPTEAEDTTASTKTSKPPAPYPTPARTTQAAATTTMAQPTTTHPRTPTTAAAGPCSSSPCHNGGLCMESADGKGYTCDCPAAWSGDLCHKDVDECLSSPCPPLSTCRNSRGSFSCRCPIGYLLQDGAGCVLVRTFLGHIEVPWKLLDGSDVKDSTLQQIKEDIVCILNSSFSTISGYYQSTITSDSHTSSNDLIVQNLFSLESNVTRFDLSRSLQSYAKVCETSSPRPTACQLVVHLQHRIQALSLCLVRNPGCDNETSVCADPAGVALCQCKPGYFKYSKTDLSCRACDDGYKLENGGCVRCPFGLGGFNCSNPYQLITVIIAAGGGGLLLILVVALAVTCCRKNKHDISKLIFKSGDFQMSPYAEYPKTQRSSEWGRETIEMQENGSTKNLLQMTDVYYSPGLRNSDIERNGLYPYTGLPGSRHSCIYPGQYNPSFINEENRRRDYF
ncbi:protein HEG homolog 1 [Leptodactylus fuscus]|uniref:protein HEG homolog 1 n=1 Tax=Leptodactylus fuscus TaxID=238119 RepID=UPI003F4E56CF